VKSKPAVQAPWVSKGAEVHSTQALQHAAMNRNTLQQTLCLKRSGVNEAKAAKAGLRRAS
jgi:hypothetical protein